MTHAPENDCTHDWEQVTLGWENFPAWACLKCSLAWPIDAELPTVGDAVIPPATTDGGAS